MAEAKPVRVGDLRQNLARYLQAAESGAEFVVVSHNRPVARFGPPPAAARRPIGLLKGRIQMADDFDTTPADVAVSVDSDVF